MAYVDVTFERGGELVKTTASVSAGWRGAGRYQFYGEQLVDFRGDVRLSAKVWMGASQSLKIFPSHFSANHDAGLIKVAVSEGRLSLLVLLHSALPWIKTSTGKWAVDWQPGQIIRHENVLFEVRHMIVVNVPHTIRGDFKEWDLLPFLPGGRVESNRRLH